MTTIYPGPRRGPEVCFDAAKSMRLMPGAKWKIAQRFPRLRGKLTVQFSQPPATGTGGCLQRLSPPSLQVRRPEHHAFWQGVPRAA